MTENGHLPHPTTFQEFVESGLHSRFVLEEIIKALIVVFIGVNPTFKVIFTPLEYVQTMSKRLDFF